MPNRRIVAIVTMLMLPALVIGSTWPAPAQAEVVERTMTHDGLERYWLEYVPDGYDPSQPASVVFALHPGLSNAASFMATSGWNEVADQHNLIVIYPQVGSTADARGSWTAYTEFDGTAERDDVGYLDAVRASVMQRYNTRSTDIFMTGFSSGAQMTNTYAALRTGSLAAIAPVSGGWADPWGVDSSLMQPSGPLPVWIWRGSEEDMVVGAPGSAVSREVHDAMQLAFWLDHHGADATPESSEVITVQGISRYFNREGELRERPWQGTHATDYYLDGLAEVWFTEVTRSGHAYHPGAAERIWSEFFATYAGSPVPEPASIVLAGGALLLVSLRRPERSGHRSGPSMPGPEAPERSVRLGRERGQEAPAN